MGSPEPRSFRPRWGLTAVLTCITHGYFSNDNGFRPRWGLTAVLTVEEELVEQRSIWFPSPMGINGRSDF